MRYKKADFKTKITSAVLLLIALIGIIILISGACLRNNYVSFSKAEARQSSAEAISKCIKSIITKENSSYSDFIRINYDNGGNVKSVETDTVKVNEIQNQIMTSVNEALSDNSKASADVPLGSLFGNTFLYGKGPDITLKFTQNGSVSVRLMSKFESAGINQTIHQIYVHVETEIYTVSPFKTEPEKFEFDYLLAETIIVGDIPKNYFSLS